MKGFNPVRIYNLLYDLNEHLITLEMEYFFEEDCLIPLTSLDRAANLQNILCHNEHINYGSQCLAIGDNAFLLSPYIRKIDSRGCFKILNENSLIFHSIYDISLNIESNSMTNSMLKIVNISNTIGKISYLSLKKQYDREFG